jgi:hypothetical protein
MTRLLLHVALLFAVAVPSSQAAPQAALSPATAATTAILTAPEAGKLLPPSVFFQGQSAPVQARNSSGIRFTKDSLMLVSLVDNSGYSSQVKQKYQAYLITSEPIDIGGHRLTPGAYGCGFITGDIFIVMDIGAHDLFSAHSTKDEKIHRPTPLQIIAAPEGGHHYRLYAGRDFVEITAPAQ